MSMESFRTLDISKYKRLITMTECKVCKGIDCRTTEITLQRGVRKCTTKPQNWIWSPFFNKPHDTTCFRSIGLGTWSRAWSVSYVFLKEECISKLDTWSRDDELNANWVEDIVKTYDHQLAPLTWSKADKMLIKTICLEKGGYIQLGFGCCANLFQSHPYQGVLVIQVQYHRSRGKIASQRIARCVLHQQELTKVYCKWKYMLR